MAPWLDISWALLAGFIVCRCVFARNTTTPRARIALLLIALLVCPIISAADDFAAISRPRDPVFSFDTVALFTLVVDLTLFFVAFGFVSLEDVSAIPTAFSVARDSRGPPLVIAA